MISIACVEMRHSGAWKITSPWIRILKRRYYKKELDSAVIVAGNWGFLKSRCSCEPKNKFCRLWNVHEKFKNTWNLNTFSSYFIEIQIILNFHFKMNMQMLRMPFFSFLHNQITFWWNSVKAKHLNFRQKVDRLYPVL